MSGPSEDTAQTPSGEGAGGAATRQAPASAEQTRPDQQPPEATVREDEYRKSHTAVLDGAPLERTLFGGRYRTERELGRGGMGRVFLGHDERLGRAVAIKVLRADVSDPSDAAQLLREARLVASLHHPNVLQVHDVGIDDGVPYLVQELLEGRMLKAELAQGPLPVERALGLALQVARGIAAAHQKGVIHCDLKPSNVFLTEEGTLKILDFGVARLHGAPAERLSSQEDSQRSQKGFSGTPSYSSPEQLRCEQIDARSDIFSLGVVLFEMVEGYRPFTGRSQLMVSYSVLTRAPAEFSKSVPRSVRKLVLRCLEKDPLRRFQDADELARALEKELARKPLSKAMRALQFTALALVALAGATALFTFVRTLLRPAPTVQQITRLPGAVWTARFAPDGKTIYYGEAFDGQRPRVLKTQIGHPEEQQEVLADAMVLAVAPSGELAVLLHPEYREKGFIGTLALLLGGGGEPRQIADKVRGADFGPDGALAITRSEGPRSTIEFPPGTVLHEAPGRFESLRWSQQGDRLAFLHRPSLTDTGGDVVLLDRRGLATPLARNQYEVSGLAWSSAGDELFFSGQPQGAPTGVDSIRAIDERGRLRPLALQNLANVELRDVSRAGLSLLTQPGRTLGLQVVDERADRNLAQQDEQLLDDLSPDGKRVLFTTDPLLPSREGYLFVRPTDGGAAVHFAEGFGGALSPDGKSALVYDWADKGLPLQLYSFAAGTSAPLPWATLGVLGARFFPDSQRALLIGLQGSKIPRLFVLTLDEQRVTPVSSEAIDQLRPIAVSPDGATVVAATAQGTVLRWPSGGGAGTAVPGITPGEDPYLFDASGGLLVGRLSGTTLELHRLDLANGQRTALPALQLHGAQSMEVGRIILARGGAVAAYMPLGWRTHLYLVEGLR